ncbi:MAG: zf-HC2 domain-containing protein [Pyrinomonadaceae bacterium]
MKANNDTTMDLLLRKHAQGDSSVPQGGDGRAPGELHNHLDPDELNAFAENALPEAARTRFASHLADCDRCRKLATELTMSAPVAMRVQPESISTTSFWSSAGQVLAGLFSLPVLRFGVPALAILLLAIVAFVALRRPTDSEFVAQKASSGDAQQQERPSALAPAESSTNEALRSTSKELREQTPATVPLATPPAGQNSALKEGEKSAFKEKDLDRGYAGAANTITTQPGFAPEPKAASEERNEKAQNAPPPVPAAKSAPSEYTLADRTRADDISRKSIDGLNIQKDEQLGKRNRDVGPAPPAKMSGPAAGSKEKGGPRRSQDQRSQEQSQAQSEGRSAGGATRPSDVSSETRKVSGRTFRRQGNTWIDTAFNSSMTVTSLPRGSEQYRSLTAEESGLRAIGEQLSNVIVVWKGKAYRIH